MDVNFIAIRCFFFFFLSFQTNKYLWLGKSPMLVILEGNKSNIVRNKETYVSYSTVGPKALRPRERTPNPGWWLLSGTWTHLRKLNGGKNSCSSIRNLQPDITSLVITMIRFCSEESN